MPRIHYVECDAVHPDGTRCPSRAQVPHATAVPMGWTQIITYTALPLDEIPRWRCPDDPVPMMSLPCPPGASPAMRDFLRDPAAGLRSMMKRMRAEITDDPRDRLVRIFCDEVEPFPPEAPADAPVPAAAGSVVEPATAPAAEGVEEELAKAYAGLPDVGPMMKVVYGFACNLHPVPAIAEGERVKPMFPPASF